MRSIPPLALVFCVMPLRGPVMLLLLTLMIVCPAAFVNVLWRTAYAALLKARFPLGHRKASVRVGVEGGLVYIEGQLAAAVLPEQCTIPFICIPDDVNRRGVHADSQRRMPVSGVALGALKYFIR